MTPHTFNSPELKDFRPEEWAHIGFWKEDLFTACFWSGWFSPSICESLGLDMPEGGAFNAFGGQVFYNKRILEHLRGQLRRFIEEGSGFFDAYKEQAHAACLASVEFSNVLPALEPTAENFERFLCEVRPLMYYWANAAVHLVWPLEELFLEKVTAACIPPEVVEKLIVIDTPLTRQQQELKAFKREIGTRSLDEIRSDADLMARLEDHRKRYAWIEISNWIGEELTLEKLFSLIEHVSLEESHVEVPQLPEDLRSLAHFVTCIGYSKQACAEYVSILTLAAYPFLNRIADEFDIPYRQLMALTHEEIAAGLNGSVPKEELVRRSASRTERNWFTMTGAGEWRILFVDDPEDLAVVKTMVPKADGDLTELKGQTANKGKVRGRAKIIMNLDEFHKMEAGDVLVTTMTTPDFVILMQKSCAIVTNIGGMLSHAAIVSREMGKPCIIGTKFATDFLTDGDMVEVDADNGVVRKI